MNEKEWCRKGKYQVQIELGCYKIDEEHPLLAGFTEKEFEGVKYAVKSGTNELENNSWETNPNRPYVITGTVGERWPVKPTDLASYEIEPSNIGIDPMPISTKEPSNQEFMVAVHIPLEQQVKVITKWAFKDDGTLDEKQIATSNLESSKVSHAEGDYVVAKHIEGEPDYMDLPEEVRNTKEMATKYSPRIINGSVMKTTYDHAKTKEEILAKYEKTPVVEEESTVDVVINTHEFRTNNKDLSEKNFSVFTPDSLIRILEKKDTILEDMKGTLYRKEKDYTTIMVSAYENGVKIDCSIEADEFMNEPGEEVAYYLFDNGDIEYLPVALDSFNWGFNGRNDSLLDQFNSKLGKKYQMKPEVKGLAALFKSTKKENEVIIKQAKEKINTRFDAAIDKINNKVTEEYGKVSEELSKVVEKMSKTLDENVKDPKDMQYYYPESKVAEGIGAVDVNDPVIEKLRNATQEGVKGNTLVDFKKTMSESEETRTDLSKERVTLSEKEVKENFTEEEILAAEEQAEREINNGKTYAEIDKEREEEKEKKQQVYDSTFNHFVGGEVFENTIPYDPNWETSEDEEIRDAWMDANMDAKNYLKDKKYLNEQSLEEYKIEDFATEEILAAEEQAERKINNGKTYAEIDKEREEESERYQQVYDSTFNHFAEKEVFENTIPYDPNWETAEESEIRNAHEWAKIDAGQKDNNDSGKVKGGSSDENGFAKPWLLGVLTGAVSVGMIMTTALLIMK